MNPLDYKFMFDRVADIYDIRPDYPLAIIEKMLDLADLKEEEDSIHSQENESKSLRSAEGGGRRTRTWCGRTRPQRLAS